MAKCNQLTPLTFKELNCIEVSAEIVLAFRRLHNENFHRLRKLAQLLLKTLDNYIYRLTERPSLASNEPCSLPQLPAATLHASIDSIGTAPIELLQARSLDLNICRHSCTSATKSRADPFFLHSLLFPSRPLEETP